MRHPKIVDKSTVQQQEVSLSQEDVHGGADITRAATNFRLTLSQTFVFKHTLKMSEATRDNEDLTENCIHIDPGTLRTHQIPEGLTEYCFNRRKSMSMMTTHGPYLVSPSRHKQTFALPGRKHWEVLGKLVGHAKARCCKGFREECPRS